MGWETIAEFHSWEEIQAYDQQHDIPSGTPFRVVYEGINWLNCLYFDSSLADWFTQAPAGFEIEDVYCDSGNGYVVGNVGSKGIGGWVVIAVVLLLALAVLGAFAFIVCKLQISLPAIVDWAKWVAVAIVATGTTLIGLALVKKRRR